ncbi:MAG: hypothetical protein ACTHWA_09125 [Arachnia sp.]
MAEDLPGVTNITDTEPTPRPGGIRWFAVVLVLAYLALLIICTVSLSRIAGDGITSWIAIGVFSVVFILGWRWWLAAGSHLRLAFRERLTVHLVGGPILVVLGSLAGLWMPAIIALSVAVMCDALNERDRRPLVEDSRPDLI